LIPPSSQLKQSLLLVAFTLGEDCFRFNTAPLLDSIKALKDKFLVRTASSAYIACQDSSLMDSEIMPQSGRLAAVTLSYGD
jgi:hypothetical protein